MAYWYTSAFRESWTLPLFPSNLEPGLTCTPDQPVAYDVTIDGKAYKQQV